ncbi:WxcM-like domain-containing protein [Taibaiella chishuiensis]|uniref:dTDP-4-dehydrorhamnose 3,5-epimerase n=1 Tax=Taibaiella chishuiensis TaxID=1434707 RepID=A0A2P8DB65_9BACT|nr:WxcM-like domain-containing protein [Taibaiella chishuiensis]PSK94466.1 dTDP-4-dehydrorhamnose 3,5-epimerase [Taibaiella chishuiensis]
MPQIIQGGRHTDARGTISFVNDFVMEEVKRFYVIEHPDTDIVRAWQGHRKEQKWFYVVSGSFRLVLVAPDNWEAPSPDLETAEFLLHAGDSQVLHVPGGYASGFKALEPNSKMIIYSDASVKESSADDFRYDKGKWYTW